MIFRALFGGGVPGNIRRRSPCQATSPPDAISAMVSRRFKPWTALFAAIVLLCAQVLLASHEVKHLGHADQGSCEVCLVGAPLGSSLASSPLAFPALAASSTVESSSLLQPALRPCRRSPPARGPPAPV